MLITFLILVLVVLGVCTINLSSLNLTENELRLLYVQDGEKSFSPDEDDVLAQSPDLNFEKDFGKDFEVEDDEDTQELAWNKFSKDLEKDGVDFDGFNSEDEALNLTKKIYEKR